MENVEDFTYAKVMKILSRHGARGAVTQVKVELLHKDLSGQNRFLTRNVRGPVRPGDFLTLMESEREARRLR